MNWLLDWSQFPEWKHALFFIEAVLVLASFAWRVRAPKVERAFDRLACHRRAPLAVGLFALALRACLLPVEPIPQPSVHDEFSYLLQADTFAHGRLANPTHPMWEHFETYHEDQFPTYASMYPFLSGVVLAAGKVLTGTAFAGVWLAGGILCAVFCWALRGWFAPHWALMGGFIAAIRLEAFSYWGNSYWGGALPAIGGALLFGALPRLFRSSRRRDAVVAAVGIVILINTRPYEGLVFSIAVALVGFWNLRKLRWRTLLPPAIAILVSAAAFMAYYNWRVFGSPGTLPYAVNRQIYAAAPVFLFQSPGPPKIYRHLEMEKFFEGWELEIFESARTWKGYASILRGKLYEGWSFFVGPVLTLPLIAFFATWKSRRTRKLLFLLGAAVLANLVVVFFEPHYLAPAAVVIYAAMLQGMRVLRRSLPAVERAIPVILVVVLGVRVALAASSLPPDVASPKTWARASHIAIGRDLIEDQILQSGGQHLVIVHYGPSHNVHAEYVFNAADIDAAPIVWARDMGPEKNAELLRYFNSRKVWWLDVDRAAALLPASAYRAIRR